MASLNPLTSILLPDQFLVLRNPLPPNSIYTRAGEELGGGGGLGRGNDEKLNQQFLVE